jgi:DNA-directed RNA polymerase
LDENGKSIFYLTSVFNAHSKKRQGLIKMFDSNFADLNMNKKNAILPRFLPMLVPPQPWDNRVYYGAYYRLKAPLMKHYSKAQSEGTKKANMGLVLEGLDYLGTIPWRVNTRIFDVVKVAIDRGLMFGELPSNKNMEEMNFDDFKNFSMKDKEKEDTKEKELSQWRKLYEDYRNRVQKKNSELHSLRCDINIKLSIAEQFLRDTIYFPHNVDFRGRAYPIPPNLSHIGSDLCRGLLMFDEAKELGEDGVRWLKIHIANLWGHNKVPFEQRVLWTESNLPKIIQSATEPLQGDMWWSNAENPFQALAACFELNECLKLSNPAQYKSRLPIHQDGSCNGLQHYAGLGRDELGGKAVNLIPSDSPQDVYTKVLEIVLRHVDQDCLISEEDTNKQLAIKGKLARIVKPLLSRKVIKQTVMTSVYGVTKVGARAQVQARLMELFTTNSTVLSVQQEKELYYAADYVADLTLISLQEMFASAKLMMDWLGTVSQLVAKEVSCICLLDGFDETFCRVSQCRG